MRLLVIDTSSVVSVALIQAPDDSSSGDAQILSDLVGTDTHRHAEDLTPAVRSALAEAGWDAPDVILAGDGPGPFTGLRVGLATAQTLAFAWGIPVYGLCSLDGLAHQAAPLAVAAGASELLAVLDARRKELYWARYSSRGERLDGPHVGGVETLPMRAETLPVNGTSLSDGVVLAGAGVAARSEQLAAHPLPVLPGTESLAVSAAHLGLAWLEQGRPQDAPRARYLRESDAVVPGSMAGVDVKAGQRG